MPGKDAMRAAVVAAVAATSLAACSSDEGSSGSTSSTAATRSGAGTSTAAASGNSSGAPSSSTDAMRTALTGVSAPTVTDTKSYTAPPQGGNVHLTLGAVPFAPTKVDASALNGHVDGAQVAKNGIYSTFSKAVTVKPAKLTSNARVVWMSKEYVLKVDDLPACESDCKAASAPADATSVLVINASSADLIGPDTKVQAG